MPQAVPVNQNGDWRLDVAFYEASIDTPRDLTDAQATLAVQPKDGTVAPALFTPGQGLVAPAVSNLVSIWIPQATVQTWSTGLWSAEIRLTWPDGQIEVAGAFDMRVSAFGQAAPAGALNIFRSAPIAVRRI